MNVKNKNSDSTVLTSVENETFHLISYERNFNFVLLEIFSHKYLMRQPMKLL